MPIEDKRMWESPLRAGGRKEPNPLKDLIKKIMFRRKDGFSVKKSLLPALTLSFAISFLLMLYGPLELFFPNQEEFYFGFSLLFPQLLIGFGVMFVGLLAVFGICYVIHVRLYDFALLAAGAAFVCTYVQGMFLAGNLPPLDGRAMDWAAYSGQNIVTYVLWVVVIAIVGLLVWRLKMTKMYGVLTGISLFLSAVLLVTGVSVGLMYGGFSDKKEVAVTTDDQFTMSTEENLVILVVDAADSRTFQRLLETDDPQFGEILSDFTYYPDTLCAYPFTAHSVPYILTGQWYENQGEFRDYVSESMAISPLLQRLRQENYRMGIYEEDLTRYNDDVRMEFENVREVDYRFSGTLDILKEEMKLVWYKYAPFPLKKYVWVYLDDFNRTLEIEGTQENFWAANFEFKENLESAQVTTVTDKCFRFIHIEGAHVPFRYDSEANLIPSYMGSYDQNMEASMTLVEMYLNLLKEAGVYDNTAIIIMGDHGYGYDRADTTLGRGNALLAVKGIGEKHDTMTVSDVPISYEDLQDAYGRLMDGAAGEAVFGIEPEADRTRRFILYEYSEEDRMVEYELNGHAFDIENMTPTGEVYEYGEEPREEEPEEKTGKKGKSGKDGKEPSEKDSPQKDGDHKSGGPKKTDGN